MTAHNHTVRVPGCFRCELSADEEATAVKEMIDDVIAYAKTVREVLPNTFYVVEHPRSRKGRYKAVHPFGCRWTNNRADAEDWLWLCSLDHKEDRP